MRLPQVPYSIKQKQADIVDIRGINFSDRFKDGELSDSLNLSTRRYPYLTTRHSRQKIDKYSNVTAISAWDKLVVVQNGRLFYNGEDVGEVTPGSKQFAVINTKLVIWPDKVYYDIDEKKIKPLSAKSSGIGAEFTTNSVTVKWPDIDFTTIFKEDDGITISGCTVNKDNNKDFVIKSVTKDTITFDDDTVKKSSETENITFERRIPDLDYICESENRLWGCSNKERTIFASTLGDPTNFYVYRGLSTDGYAVAVGSEGDFTGCCKLSSSVLFWKNSMLHKILGGYPAEYQLYSYNMEGVLSGCNKSMQVINENLFYLTAHGIYVYSGGSTNFLSHAFGEHLFFDGVAGNDGDTYYLSAREGEKWSLLTYDIKNGIWLKEDNLHIVDFARIGKEVYLLTDTGDIYLEDSGKEDEGIEWLAQFKPFYENIDGRKKFSRLIVRVQVPKGSWAKIETRFDNGLWTESCKIIGQENDAVTIPIVINRCDKFEIRFSGVGQFTILNFLRQFTIGGTA